MAQAAELTLSFAAKQIEAVYQNPKASQFLGRDFQLVGKKVGYFDLIESLQKCIHTAKEKNYKTVAGIAFDRLKEIAIAQTLAHPDKIELIDKVARAALNPTLLFNQKAHLAKIPIDEILLRKALTVLLLGKEYFLSATASSQSTLRAIAARKKRLEVSGAPIQVWNKWSLFADSPPKGANATALLLCLAEAQFKRDDKSTYVLTEFSDENIKFMQDHAGDDDPEVRALIHKKLTAHECERTISNHNFLYDSIFEGTTRKTYLINENLDFLKTFFPPFHLTTDPKLEIKQGDVNPAPHELRIKINQDAEKFDPYFHYIYRFFYMELMHRYAKGGKPANLTSSLPSLFKDDPNYVLPSPEKVKDFIEERRLMIENHPKAPKRDDRKIIEKMLGPALPEERKVEEPPKSAPFKRPTISFGHVDLTLSAAAALPLADQPAAKAPPRSYASAITGVAEMAERPAAAAAAAAAAALPLPNFHTIDAILAHSPAPKIVYSDRVNQFYDYQGVPSFEIDGHWRHAFPRGLDAFLGNESYVQKGIWINRKTGHHDMLYIMIGEVEVSKDNWRRCQFEWCVGADGLCYHHFCSFEKNVLEDWIKGIALSPENFPTLEESYRDATWKGDVSKKVQEDIQMELHPVWKYVTFTDKETKISFKIFGRGK